MIRPWINFTGICAVVMGIVLFCVVFGGYSSLHRSQNRIHTVHQMLTEQCASQVELAKGLAQTPGADRFQEEVRTLSRSAAKLNVVLLTMTSSQDPMPEDLIRNFETAQADLRRDMTEFINRISTAQDVKELEKRQNETDNAVLVMIRKYNKEARYYNTRSRQFPGTYIARLFKMDRRLFPEIAPPSVTSGETASAS